MEQQRDALRRQVLAEIERLQALEAENPKETYRSWHAQAVQRELARQQYWIRATYPKYEHFFANGSDLSPQSIRPILLEVVEEWQADLFRLTRLTWSLPFTRGYGRRLRFLIMDASNEKLIGIWHCNRRRWIFLYEIVSSPMPLAAKWSWSIRRWTSSPSVLFLPTIVCLAASW